MKKLLKMLNLRIIWLVLAGFLPGVLVGGVIAILGLFLLAPEPNLPAPQQDNSPGDVTIQLSQSFLNAVAQQKISGKGIPVPGVPGGVPFDNVKVQPRSSDELLITGTAEFPLSPRPMIIDLQPCVSSQGKPAFKVWSVSLNGMDITRVVGQSVQDKINNGFSSVNLSVPNEHLARIQTTTNALILIYTSGSSGQGQPAC